MDFQRLIDAGFTRLPVTNRFQSGDLIVERGRSGDWYRWDWFSSVWVPITTNDPVETIINRK